MAAKNFPGPNINRIIENDPQIISQGNKQYFEWGSRASAMPKGSNTQGNEPGQAPGTSSEQTIKHV